MTNDIVKTNLLRLKKEIEPYTPRIIAVTTPAIRKDCLQPRLCIHTTNGAFATIPPKYPTKRIRERTTPKFFLETSLRVSFIIPR